MARSPIPGVSMNDIQRWITAGLLRLPNTGSGWRRSYSDPEARAAMALDSLRRLGGVEVQRGSPSPGSGPHRGAHRRLQVAVANAARNNPPGAVVEIPSPVSWVRIIVVVPEP